MIGLISKWALKSIVMMTLMFGVSSYLMYLSTGRTPWSLLGINTFADVTDRIKPDLSVEGMSAKVKQQMARLSSDAGDLVPNAVTQALQDAPAEQAVYKWVDEQGVTHFSETPPDNKIAETVLLDPNRNVIKGLPDKNSSADGAVANANPMESAKGLQKMVDDAEAQRQAVMDNP